MKSIVLMLSLISYMTGTIAQILPIRQEKPVVDTNSFDNWLSVKPTWVDAKVTVSSDGNYVLYKIRESWELPASMIIQAVSGNSKLEFPGVESAVFTDNGRKAIFIKSGDSLCLLTLNNSSISYIPQVNGFKLFQQGNTEWIAYQLNTPGKELVLFNLETGGQKSFSGVSEYVLSHNGNIVVLKTTSLKDSNIKQSISWVNLSSDKSTVIWEGKNAFNLVLDDGGNQLVFMTEGNGPTPFTMEGRNAKSCWYYKEGTNPNQAVQLTSNQSAGIDKGLQLEGIWHFSKDGSRIFCYLKENLIAKPPPDAVRVDVWSYTDAKLQSQQLNELRWTPVYAAVLDINSRYILRLQYENEDILSGMDGSAADQVLISSRAGELSEWNWSRAAQPASFLVNTSTGERKEIALSNPQMLPGGKYIIGIGHDSINIYSHEITTGITRNITGSLPIPAGSIEYDEPQTARSRGLWTDGTIVNEGSIIVYDEYDIWQLDLSGKKTPVNLTNGYGRKNKMVFRLAKMYAGKNIPGNGQLIISAFNKTNKNNGFYCINMEKRGNPLLLSMGPWYYDAGYNSACQVKARDAATYIVLRECAAESPNYFLTKDFKSFTPLSTVYPEKKYNWLTAELLSFRTLNGQTEQAVLYKPENFDPQKKYPVILHYYERMSQELNRYRKPGGYAHLDIPWFVSHGYIVVTPDIHYRIGETGKSAFNAIVGVAKHLARFSWVDTKHIGLQGHSFGGYQTNYIVTQTNLFAAAVSSSGISDFISNYLGLLGDHTNHDWYENRICRIGVTLWQRPDLYISNSPVFYANKVTTPILTIANKKDGNVRFEQGLEWFVALRRLGKRAWMLQYDDGDHALSGKDFKDYVIRMSQFFDHYLKGKPAPRWMTRGIPAKMKGIDKGLELDDKIKTPGTGLVMDKSAINQ